MVDVALFCMIGKFPGGMSHALSIPDNTDDVARLLNKKCTLRLTVAR